MRPGWSGDRKARVDAVQPVGCVSERRADRTLQDARRSSAAAVIAGSPGVLHSGGLRERAQAEAARCSLGLAM
jgi:hypothetical protein